MTAYDRPDDPVYPVDGGAFYHRACLPASLAARPLTLVDDPSCHEACEVCGEAFTECAGYPCRTCVDDACECVKSGCCSWREALAANGRTHERHTYHGSLWAALTGLAAGQVALPDPFSGTSL